MSRYSNSVSIGKGMKVNFGRSGPSVSFKAAGMNLNLSTKGVKVSKTTTRKKTTGRKNSSSRRTSKTISYTMPMPDMSRPIAFTLQMNEKGQTWVVDDNGREITDAATLRKIKADPSYQEQKEMLEEQRQNDIAQTLEEAYAENEKFLNIYRYAPVVDNLAGFEAELANLKPEIYEREEFNLPKPDPAEIRNRLENEALEKVTGFFLTINRKREEYVNTNLAYRLEKANQAWLEEKYAFEEEQDRLEAECMEHSQEEFESRKAYLSLVLQGDSEILLEAIDQWIGECQLPVEIALSYNWDEEDGTLYLDMDLPEIEDLPQIELSQLENGNIKEKNKTQKQLRDEYATMVFGLAVFVTCNVFNLSPAIHRILLSGYTQRRDKNGDLQDDYIYSIKFFREMFEGRDMSEKDPMDVCMAAENRCNTTSTLLFKKIEPYESF